MRLIHIPTLKLEEFFESDIPPYAILSHRWGSQELNFKEVNKGKADQSKSGYRKLVKAAEVAATYDVSYLWIDTCCIDKRSSAELSEAINSMCSWYQNAETCLAFLEDVTSGPSFDGTFRASVWFTRSWTLQELLVPGNVIFYDGEWNNVGSRDSQATTIEEITGISIDVLIEPKVLWDWPIANRMAWAANRTSTRTEDIAYSLMGIFDVNMPLLYGEGRKAFIRLQEEIIKRTTDPTFLLWDTGSAPYPLFASCPGDFRECTGTKIRYTKLHTPLNLTNLGLEIESVLLRWNLQIYGLLLGPNYQGGHVVLLRRYPFSDAMYRVGLAQLDRYVNWFKVRKVNILWQNHEQTKETTYSRPRILRFGFEIKSEANLSVSKIGTQHGRVTTPARTDSSPLRKLSSYKNDASHIICDFNEPRRPSAAHVTFKIGPDGKYGVLSIDLSFDFDSRPCILVHTGDEKRSVWEVSELIEEKKRPGHRQAMGNHEMIRTVNEATGNAAFFLRTPDPWSMSTLVPKELTSSPLPIHIRLVHPIDGNPVLWSFNLGWHRTGRENFPERALASVDD